MQSTNHGSIFSNDVDVLKLKSENPNFSDDDFFSEGDMDITSLAIPK
jgi:hypothetical protein